MREIKTDADGVPVWSERFAWKIERFWWEFVEALEGIVWAFWDLLKNPFMIMFLVLTGVNFTVSAIGTWLWGW